MDQFDYVIVGAGTAGCLAANRLSADPDVRVLLLEAGGRDNYHWIHIPIGYLYCIGNPRTDWRYTTQAEAGLNGRSLLYPRGRVLGGSSSINGMIYMRGQREDYDGWAQLAHDPSWRWDAVLPLFKRCEDHYRGASEFHGAGGEWRVEPQRLSWKILDAFRQAAAEAGIPPTEDFNTGDNEGCGYFQVNQRRGVRWSAANAFLHPVRHRANLAVYTHAQAKHLLFEGKRCVICPTPRSNETAVATIERLWTALGAEPVRMTAELHDRVFGAGSHLPHVAAYALAAALGQLAPDVIDGIRRLPTSSLRDTTRVAASSPAMWRDIFLDNRAEVLPLIEALGARLNELRAAVAAGDADKIEKVLIAGKAGRDRVIAG